MLKPSSEKSVLKLFELIFGKSVLVPPCPILLDAIPHSTEAIPHCTEKPLQY